jgi:hypothetical protein
MNDLRDGEPLEEQVVSVLASAPVDLHRAGASGPQHGHELVQEQRNPMVDFRFIGGVASISSRRSLDTE